jgi:hypothetical protein
MSTIIKLLASDFENAEYINTSDCPVARSASRYTGLVMSAGDTFIGNGNTLYRMNNSNYHFTTFTIDKIKAKNFNFSPEVVIREIEFIDELPLSAEENPYAMCSND